MAELVNRGKPLVEVIVVPNEGVDRDQLCNLLDNLSPDIGANVDARYFQPSSGPMICEIRMDATAEELAREFGWDIYRDLYVPGDGIERPDLFSWEERNRPQFYPSQVDGMIYSMGLTQPGANDNGMDDNVKY